jgi:hypothetical protein
MKSLGLKQKLSELYVANGSSNWRQAQLQEQGSNGENPAPAWIERPQGEGLACIEVDGGHNGHVQEHRYVLKMIGRCKAMGRA